MSRGGTKWFNCTVALWRYVYTLPILLHISYNYSMVGKELQANRIEGLSATLTYDKYFLNHSIPCFSAWSMASLSFSLLQSPRSANP